MACGAQVGIVKPLALAWDPWLPCPDHHWCTKFGDRFSTSLVNRRVPYTFSATNPGVIIAPSAPAPILSPAPPPPGRAGT